MENFYSLSNTFLLYQHSLQYAPFLSYVVLRPSKILLETRSACSKIWVLKLACLLEFLLGLSYRDGDQV